MSTRKTAAFRQPELRSKHRPTVRNIFSLTLLSAWALFSAAPSSADIAYVSNNFAVPQTTTTSVTATFTTAQAAHDLNVVIIGWHDSSVSVSAVSTREDTFNTTISTRAITLRRS